MAGEENDVFPLTQLSGGGLVPVCKHSATVLAARKNAGASRQHRRFFAHRLPVGVASGRRHRCACQPRAALPCGSTTTHRSLPTSSRQSGAPSSNCDVLPYPCPCKYRQPNLAWRDGAAPLVPAPRDTRERRRGMPSDPTLLSCRCAQAGLLCRPGWSPAGCCGCRWCRRSCRPFWPWKRAALGSP